jgi:hypothetical protein
VKPMLTQKRQKVIFNDAVRRLLRSGWTKGPEDPESQRRLAAIMRAEMDLVRAERQK